MNGLFNLKMLVPFLFKNKKFKDNEVITEKKKSTNTFSYIVKQNCIKASANFHSKRVADIDDVIRDAEKMYNWINK